MSSVILELPQGPVGPDSELDVLERAAAAAAQVSWPDTAKAGLGEALVQVNRVERLVASTKVAILGAFDASGEYRADLHPSASTWLAAKAKADRRRVTHQVGVARTMRSMPLVEAAFRDALIGFEHVAVLARVWAPAFADQFAQAEAELVAAAQVLDYDVFYRAALSWRDYVDPDGAAERARKQLERRSAHASRTIDGMVRVDAWLDAIDGTEFLAELHRIEQQLFEADWAAAREIHGDRATKLHLGRSAEQRRADAMVEMARRSNTCENPAEPPKWVLNLMMGYATFCAEAAAAAGEAAGHEPGCPHAAAGGDDQDQDHHEAEPHPFGDGDLADLADLEGLADLEDLAPAPGGAPEDTEGPERHSEAGPFPSTHPDDDLAGLPDLSPATDPAEASTDDTAGEQARPGMRPPREPLVLPDWWRAVDPLPNAGLADTGMYDLMCELEDYTKIAPSLALSLGLAGTIRRVVFGPDGHILDFGQDIAYLPEPGKEAVRIRDRECRDPGCSVPGRHCEIDHYIPRSRGGPTSVRNSRCECKSGNRLKGDRMPDRGPRRD